MTCNCYIKNIVSVLFCVFFAFYCYGCAKSQRHNFKLCSEVNYSSAIYPSNVLALTDRGHTKTLKVRWNIDSAAFTPAQAAVFACFFRQMRLEKIAESTFKFRLPQSSPSHGRTVLFDRSYQACGNVYIVNVEYSNFSSGVFSDILCLDQISLIYDLGDYFPAQTIQLCTEQVVQFDQSAR